MRVHPTRGLRSRWVLSGSAALAVALAVVTTFVVVSDASSSHHGRASAAPTTTTTDAPPLVAVAASPAPGAEGVALDAPVSVSFSGPVSTGGALPALDPPVAGTWTQPAPTELSFNPAGGALPPGVTETLTVPAGPTGVEGPHGEHLAKPLASSFTVAPLSTLRVQEILAELGYLPLSFTPAQPTSPSPADSPALDAWGTFAWRWPDLPASLTSLWQQGEPNVITRGAVMSFEDQHGLAADGVVGPQVSAALLNALAANQTNPYGHWDWVDVSMNLPETVTVWRDGAVVYQTLANTGVPGAATATGTYPVFERFQSATMTGTNPDGTHYSDPGIPWISYFNGGDALHGYVRAQYGFPQSDGCVEMPPANAAVVWPLTPIGTLVTVE